MAREADTDLKISRIRNGIGLYFSGYGEGIDLLLNNTLKEIKEFRVKDRKFRGYQYGWTEYMKNLDEIHPLTLANDLKKDLISTPSYSPEEMNRGFREASNSRLITMLEDWKENMHITSMAYGNVNKAEVEKWNREVLGSLVTEKGADTVRESVTKLPRKVSRIVEESEFTDSVDVVYIQGWGSDYIERARFRLLEKLMSEQFFTDLRTEKQLGYVVHAKLDRYLNIPGFKLYIQSPVQGPANLEYEILGFLESFQGRLMKLDEKEFKSYKETLHQEMMAEAKELETKTNRVWSAVRFENMDLEYREKIGDQVEKITKGDFAEWYAQRFTGDDRRLLSVLVIGDSQDIPYAWKSDTKGSQISSFEDFHESSEFWSIDSPASHSIQ